MLEGQGHFEADYFVDGLRRTALKDPRTTANIATTAAKLAGLLSEGAGMTMDAMAMTATVAIASTTDTYVTISKVYFIAMMQLIKLLLVLKN